MEESEEGRGRWATVVRNLQQPSDVSQGEGRWATVVRNLQQPSDVSQGEGRWATLVRNLQQPNDGSQGEAASEGGEDNGRCCVHCPRRQLSNLWEACFQSAGADQESTEQQVPEDAVPCPLSYYLEQMRSIGTCPPVATNNSTKIKKLVYWILYIFFCIITLWFCLKTVKFHALNFLGNDGQLDRFTGFATSLVGGLCKTYFMYFMTFRFKDMVLCLEDLVLVEEESGARKEAIMRSKMIGKCAVLTSIILVIIHVIFYFNDSHGWSFDRLLRIEAYAITRDFVAWSKDTFEEHTDQLWEEIYRRPLTGPKAVLGICSLIINFWGWLQEHMLHDVILLVAWSLTQHMSKLVTNFDKGIQQFNQIWDKYQRMKTITNRVNDILSKMVTLNHIYNMLILSYFLLESFKREKHIIGTLGLAVHTGKFLGTYWIASDMVQKNKDIKQWMKLATTEFDQIFINGKKVEKSILLDEVTVDVIGFGNDESHVNQGFLVKFIGSVSTVFLLLAGEVIRNRECCACTPPTPPQ